MKKRIIIIASSIVALALIIALGVNASIKSQDAKKNATEQVSKNVPERCKKCPSAAQCFDDKGNKVEGACTGQCGDCSKTASDTKGTCASKCGGENKAESTSCASSPACGKECPHQKK